MTPNLQHKLENIISRNPQADDREVVFQLKQLLHEVELQNCADTEAKSIAGLVVENIRQLDDEACRNMIIKSGFSDFDTQFGGFRLGEFIVVGGRPAMGKTQFLVNLSLNISTRVPVLYVTLNLSESLLTSRFISAVSEIPVGNILQNDLDAKQKNRLFAIANEFTKHQLFIHDCCDSSIAALKALCQKQIQENRVQVIIVDYLQLICSYKHRYRELELSYICRELKNIAKENSVCVIASSQLSRSVEYRSGSEGKRPLLSDLRESGAIEQDADKVLFIYRPEYYAYFEDAHGNSLINTVEIIVAKNRNGSLGEFRLFRDDNFTNFRNMKNEITFSSDRLFELEDAPF